MIKRFVAAAALSAFALPAQATQVDSLFSIYFKGVPVAEMRNSVSVKGDRYEIRGVAKSNRLISMVANSKASFQSTGRVKGTRIVPLENAVSYKSGKRKGFSKLKFNGNDVVQFDIQPKPKKKPDTVPLKPSHWQGVLDPVSSLVFAVKDGDSATGEQVCRRDVPVFDGRNRMTLKFSYKGEASSRPPGISGPVYRCAVRYVPVAGHRSKNKGTRFMAGSRDIEVSVTRLGETDVFGLVGFSIPTRAGVVSGIAERVSMR